MGHLPARCDRGPLAEWTSRKMLNRVGEWPPTLTRDRHNRGWPRFQLLTYVTVTDQSWRYCIEPMGYRDTIWGRSGYVELIRWQQTK
jgi:hypothetical protein